MAAYRDRVQVETTISMFKRRLDGFIRVRTYWSQCRELRPMNGDDKGNVTDGDFELLIDGEYPLATGDLRKRLKWNQPPAGAGFFVR